MKYLRQSHKEFAFLAKNYADVVFQKKYSAVEGAESHYINLCNMLPQLETSLLPLSKTRDLDYLVREFVEKFLQAGESGARSLDWVFFKEDFEKISNRTEEAILRIPGFLDTWRQWLKSDVGGASIFQEESKSKFWCKGVDSLYGVCYKGEDKLVSWKATVKNIEDLAIHFSFHIESTLLDGARLVLIEDEKLIGKSSSTFQSYQFVRNLLHAQKSCYSCTVEIDGGATKPGNPRHQQLLIV